MAKGNLLMGTVRGKLGDNVMYVKNGEQCHRKLRKNIYNPKTAKQIYQRSIMATVMLAYSQGKAIFDHSFQGKKVPAGSQQKFMSDNLRLLRQKLAADINNARLPEDCTMSVVAPKSYCTVPNAFKVSEGTLIQNLFSWDEGNGKYDFVTLPTTATFAGFCNQYNVRPGDIFTFVAFGGAYVDATFDEMPDGATQFGWLRFTLKNLAADFVISDATKYGDIFNIEGTGFVANTANKLIFDDPTEPAIHIFDVIAGLADTNNTGAIACIKSREDSKSRSTEIMHLVRDGVGQSTAATGITAPHIYTEWTTGGIDADSQLILEGGEGYRNN